ncbi:hypothetical protein BDV95DRAFT_286877 [Massariosphaeria phaeospora]|uniref:Uncharacterized protein n=1 Tax=Massariosphaeria phaeospora TaxID=100035 RepID=A0A7C8IC49_9PLEO|nr:hypothetical protein BDV95DRAFT_286877 [Massariosphaeria phaeospora]
MGLGRKYKSKGESNLRTNSTRDARHRGSVIRSDSPLMTKPFQQGSPRSIPSGRDIVTLDQMANLVCKLACASRCTTIQSPRLGPVEGVPRACTGLRQRQRFEGGADGLRLRSQKQDGVRGSIAGERFFASMLQPGRLERVCSAVKFPQTRRHPVQIQFNPIPSNPSVESSNYCSWSSVRLVPLNLFPGALLHTRDACSKREIL